MRISMVLALVFAEGGLEALSGGSGWFGAGLLGVLLAWLLGVHLPAKDKQMERLIADKDKVVGDMMTRHEVIQKESRIAYEKTLETIASHCEKEINVVREIADKMFQSVNGGKA